MRREGPLSITVEEAVAAMVNMYGIPTGFTLLEMLEAFQEEAEDEYDDARIDSRPNQQILPLEIRMHILLLAALNS